MELTPAFDILIRKTTSCPPPSPPPATILNPGVACMISVAHHLCRRAATLTESHLGLPRRIGSGRPSQIAFAHLSREHRVNMGLTVPIYHALCCHIRAHSTGTRMYCQRRDTSALAHCLANSCEQRVVDSSRIYPPLSAKTSIRRTQFSTFSGSEASRKVRSTAVNIPLRATHEVSPGNRLICTSEICVSPSQNFSHGELYAL